MSSEDQELMARIAAMAGQINRHKNQQAGFTPTPAPRHVPQRMFSTAPQTSDTPVDGIRAVGGGYSSRFHRGAPYPTRYRGPSAPTHRHRTLVLNGANQQNKTPDADSGTDTSNSTWVSKNDRHLQLINKSIYEQDSQARIRAIEQTRRQKLASRDKQERAKLHGYFNHATRGSGTTNMQGSPNTYEIVVEGVRFIVGKSGSKLFRAPGDGNSIKATPKVVEIAGVKFHRSKNGNLIRQGIVKAQRRMGVKKVNEPCRMFSTTGSCLKGPQCRFQHDPWRTAVCKDLLHKGECKMGDACDLSHDMTPERMPTCLHFVRDQCTNPNCKYAHAKVLPDAPVCRSFGLYGYCEKGAECPERHAFECPDFSNTGVCNNKGCKLLHRERAGFQRKNTAADDDKDMEDATSDDDGDSIDSNDVDSDEVEEFIGQEDDNLDFEQQKDFIPF